MLSTSTKLAAQTDINTNIYDNTTNDISGADLNTTLLNLVNTIDQSAAYDSGGTVKSLEFSARQLKNSAGNNLLQWSDYIRMESSVYLNGYTGGGTRMLTVASDGLIGSTALPTGLSGLVTNYLPKASSSSTLTNSQISDSGTAIGIASLAGVGTRMVVSDASGVLSATTAPPSISGLSANRIPKATSPTALADSRFYDDGTYAAVGGAITAGVGFSVNLSGTYAFEFLPGFSAENYLQSYNRAASFVPLKVNAASYAFQVGSTNALNISAGGFVTIPTLAGAGTRMVTTDSAGNLSTATVPAGISGLTTDYLPRAGSATTLVNSQISDNGTAVTITSLAGTGTRDVVASSTGVLSTLPAVSLTTTGTSGAATYNSSTRVLNIPNYATGGGISGLTTGKVPKAASASTLSDSLLVDGGSYMQINTTSTFGGSGSRGNLIVNFGIAAVNPSDPNSGVSLTSESGYDQLQSYNSRNIVMQPAGNNIGVGANPNSGIRLHVHGNAYFGEAHLGSNGWIFGGYNHNNGGFLATMMGGRQSEAAASYCITMGSSVKAMHSGTLVIGDQFDAPVMPTVALNEFRARFRGGFHLHTDINGTNNAFRVLDNGQLYAGVLSTYATNALAVAAGLVVNTIYKTVTGELRIVV